MTAVKTEIGAHEQAQAVSFKSPDIPQTDVRGALEYIWTQLTSLVALAQYAGDNAETRAAEARGRAALGARQARDANALALAARELAGSALGRASLEGRRAREAKAVAMAARELALNAQAIAQRAEVRIRIYDNDAQIALKAQVFN